ncbi:uncharacterized protein LOC131940884 [Physella acuta]|uniref:uncharacterized protein LOC131940884 n=1 Tax=Physella acuta TaxID=109671 RepID=UPI0027DC74EC|nr:uncharacterized protein LOC131940884 [Physella acuta]
MVLVDNNDDTAELKSMIESYFKKYGVSFSYIPVKTNEAEYDRAEKKTSSQHFGDFSKQHSRSGGFWPSKDDIFVEPEDKKVDVRRMKMKDALDKVVHFIDRMTKIYRQTKNEADRYIYIVTGYGSLFGNKQIKRGIVVYFKMYDYGKRYIWINSGLMMVDLKEDINTYNINSTIRKKRRFVYTPNCEPEDKKLDIRGKKKNEAMNEFRIFIGNLLETYKTTGNKEDRYAYVVTGYKASNPEIGPVLKPAVQDYLVTNGYETRHEWFNNGGLVMIDLEEDDDKDDVTSEGEDVDDVTSEDDNDDVSSDIDCVNDVTSEDDNDDVSSDIECVDDVTTEDDVDESYYSDIECVDDVTSEDDNDDVSSDIDCVDDVTTEDDVDEGY